MKKAKYCKHCGNELITKKIDNEGDIPYCSSCDSLFFPSSDIAIIAVITNDQNEILMLKQNVISDHYVLVAGYYKQGEKLEQTVIREVFEETGIAVENVTPIGNYYYEKKNIVMFGFHGHAINTDIHIDPNEVDDAAWIKVSKAVETLKEASIAQQVVKDYLINKN